MRYFQVVISYFEVFSIFIRRLNPFCSFANNYADFNAFDIIL